MLLAEVYPKPAGDVRAVQRPALERKEGEQPLHVSGHTDRAHSRLKLKPAEQAEPRVAVVAVDPGRAV